MTGRIERLGLLAVSGWLVAQGVALAIGYPIESKGEIVGWPPSEPAIVLEPVSALVLTLLIEVGLLIAMRNIWFPALPGKTLALAGVLINCFTNPLVWWIRPGAISEVLVIEALVVLAEALLYMLLLRQSYGRMLPIAFALNLTSFVIGLMVGQ